jgi:hypothetical protein
MPFSFHANARAATTRRRRRIGAEKPSRSADAPPPTPMPDVERRTGLHRIAGARRLGDGLGTLGFEIVDIAALLKLVDDQAVRCRPGLGDLRGSASEIERALDCRHRGGGRGGGGRDGSVDHARDSMDRMQAASGLSSQRVAEWVGASGPHFRRSRPGSPRSSRAPRASATSLPRSGSSPSTPASSPPVRASTARVSPSWPKPSANWRGRPPK